MIPTPYLSRTDHHHIASLLKDREFAGQTNQTDDFLKSELARSRIMDTHELPGDAVSMYSEVVFVDTESGKRLQYTLTYPHETEAGGAKLSVLSPIGAALIGYRTGDHFTVETSSGVREYRIEKVSSASLPQE